jgi:hypothetical protein
MRRFDVGGNLLDQGHDVAHAQNTTCVVLGTKRPRPSIFSLVPANLMDTPVICRTNRAHIEKARAAKKLHTVQKTDALNTIIQTV